MLKRIYVYMIAVGLILLSCAEKPEKSEDETGADLNEMYKRAVEFSPKPGKYGGSIVIPAFSDPSGFNPLKSEDPFSSRVVSLMFEGLTIPDPVTGESQPALASEWSVSEDSLEWVFSIREGGVWSDSTPVTASDVVFTYRLAQRIGSSRYIFPESTSVASVDSKSVKFTLKERFAYLPLAAALPLLPEHRFSEKADTAEFYKTDTDPDSIVCSGPYLLSSYASFQKIVLERNPVYYKEGAEGKTLPYLDSIVFRMESDMDMAFDGFLEGKIGYYPGSGRDYDTLLGLSDSLGYEVHVTGPPRSINALMFNLGSKYTDSLDSRPSVYTSRDFRKGLSYAIDREKMIDSLCSGMGYVQRSPLSPAYIRYYDSTLSQDSIGYNPERASALFKEAGLQYSEGDSVFLDKDSNVVDLSIIVNGESSFRRDAAEMVAGFLKDVGIQINILIPDIERIRKMLVEKERDWDIILGGFTTDHPWLQKDIWTSQGRLCYWDRRDSSDSVLEWHRRIDSIFTEIPKLSSKVERRHLFTEWQRIAAEELPLVFLILPERVECISSEFGNVNPAPGADLLAGLEYIYRK